jgi:hypothetical protein
VAQAFELSGKIGLPPDAYFVVQRLQPRWSSFAVLLVIQILALSMAAFLMRRRPRVLVPLLLALFLVLANQAVFWAVTHPANMATADWTVQTADWIALRLRWEYAQAASAALQLLAMTCLVVAVLCRLPSRTRSYTYY